ncbi:hypothetical protein ABZ260_42980, partial [Streptosporangium sp. NPDC006013]|uniref:hypothetical protein n=1 Tax=Streptosporangium sp. NPDC006013 TaxID=3155596 RepID=UPI0033AD2F7F
AVTVDRPDQIGPAWEQALSADRPMLLDVHVDSLLSPVPGAASRVVGDANASRFGRWDPAPSLVE